MTKETLAATAVVLLAVFLLNPLDIWMPTMAVVCAVALALVAVAALAALVLAERAADEREEAHRMHAGRWAFLAGTVIATAGIAVQAFSHAVDPWLVATLTAMVVVKIGSRTHSERHR